MNNKPLAAEHARRDTEHEWNETKTSLDPDVEVVTYPRYIKTHTGLNRRQRRDVIFGRNGQRKNPRHGR